MNTALDPRILAKLEAFAQRRRKLIIYRGIATALAMLLATMLLVAAADYFFVLSDQVRWALSGAAYLAVLIAEWRICWRLLAHAPGPKLLARLVEHAEPKLREDLLSAVELSGTRDARVFDSPQFRELLQQDVAARMDGLTMERLLPVWLVRRTIFFAAAVVIAVIVLVAVSGLQLGTLMLRALIPGANLARVSKTQVQVISPAPAETRVPFGDAVPLVVKLSGAPAREVWLETFGEHEGRQMVKLNAIGKDQFSGAIQVGREDLRYRLRAGDAITRKYLLDAEPRPYAVKFTKTFHLPAYMRTEPWSVTEESGDLIGLEGTGVDLNIETDQPVKSAELRIDQGRKVASLPLTIEKDGHLTGHIPLAASGTYRVHLVAAKTDFENKFSPEYELRADPDLVPKVEFVEPKGDLILPANDLVDVVGEVSDDQAIARIEQHIRVNEGPWQTVPLAGESGKEKKITRRWDLYAQGARSGDLLTTKLVAYDLKGNRGESRSLQITITAAGIELKRTESLSAFLKLHESLKAWRTAVEALGKATSEARQRFEQTAENDPQRAAALTALNAAYTEFEQHHATTAAALAGALRGAQPGHQGADLVAMGRQLGKIESGMLRQAKGLVAVVASAPAAPSVKQVMRDVDDLTNRSMQRARAVEEGFRVLLNSEEADLLAENTQIIRVEQARLTDLARTSGDDKVRWEALGNRVRVVLSETRTMEEILDRLGERGLGGDKGRNIARELKKQREQVEAAMKEQGMNKELLRPVVQLADGITKAEKGALELRAELERRPVQVNREFRQDAQPTWSQLNRLPGELDRIASNKTLPPERTADLQAVRWDAARDTFKVHGDLEEIRPSSDAVFVGDLRAATTALEGLRVLFSGNGVASVRDRLAAFDRIFRLIESAADLQELLDGLTVLTNNERWQVATPRSRTVAPRDWSWLEQRLKETPNELGKLDQKEEAIRKAVEEARKVLSTAFGQAPFRDLDREMNERRRPDHASVSMRSEAEALAAEVRYALELLKPQVDRARDQLQHLAPKLNEVAQALAKKAEELKQEAKQQQEQAREKSEEQVRQDAAKAVAQQEQLNEKLDALKDLLRADANKQDMLDAAQRERARDADDALAMLKEPPTKAADALKDAAQAQTKSAQEQALAQAAEQQQKLTQALDQIAKHYEAMDQGKEIKDSRMALRQKEQELGLKQELDQQYAKAERMAQLAKSSPQEMLKQLEKALPNNPLMQQELSAISQGTLDDAHRKLEAASKAENRIAENVSQLAQKEYAEAQAQNAPRPPNDPLNGQNPAQPQANPAASPDQNSPKTAAANEAKPNAPNGSQPSANPQPAGQPPQSGDKPQNAGQPQNPQLAKAAEDQSALTETAAEAGADVSRAGRHEERLQNKSTGQRLQQLGQEISETASAKLPAAQQALMQSPRAGDAQKPVAAANQDLANETAQLSRGAHGQEDGAPVPDLPNPPSEQMSAAQMQAAQQMAQGMKPASASPTAQSPVVPQSGAPQNAQAYPQPPGAPSPQAPEPRMAVMPIPGMPVLPNQPVLPESMLTAATAQEQTWMARTLDALDTALNAPSESSGQQQGQQQAGQQGQQDSQNGQQQQGQNQQAQQGQKSSQGQQQQQQQAQNGQQSSMTPAQQAMQQAAQAAQQVMRQARSQNVAPSPQSMAQKGDQQAKSEQGALAQMNAQNHGALPDAKSLKPGDWGKLPKQMAEQLSRGQGEAVSSEYRGQVETYYRVIAERAKKP